MVRWVVQSNLVHENLIETMAAACKKVGVQCDSFKAVPFSDELPDIATDGAVVFYGSTRVTEAIHRSRKWVPGVFFNDSFRFEEYDKHWGARMLNHGATVTTLNALARENRNLEEWLFVRPCADSKVFAGDVFRFGDLVLWRGRLKSSNPEITGDTLIVVGEPFGIPHEWRLFVVDGVVVGGSHYRSRLKRKIAGGVPGEVKDFAGDVASIWAPSQVFTLDVCETGGELYVVEAGCFNSAGFYRTDVYDVVSAVTDFVDSHF